MKKIIVILALFFISVVYNSQSQEIKATVNVNVEQVNEDNRLNVSSLASDLETYLNTQRFTEKDWEGPPIPVDITIVLSGGYNHRYQAQIFIASKRYLRGQGDGTSITMKLIDKEWSFEYARGAMFSFSTMRYNEFSSLLDYYMLLIIGFDSDTYGELEGTQCYEKAKMICQLGASQNVDGFRTYYKPGEFTRYSLITELSDLRYEPIRKIIYGYYADGLDMMIEDKKLAMETIAYLISQMAKFKSEKLTSSSVLMTAFFDAKAIELAELFKGSRDYPFIFKNLIYLDPSNTMLYQASADGK